MSEISRALIFALGALRQTADRSMPLSWMTHLSPELREAAAANAPWDHIERLHHRQAIRSRRKTRHKGSMPRGLLQIGTSKRPLGFIHLAKTGGVTLSDIFAANCLIDHFVVLDLSRIRVSALGTWSAADIAAQVEARGASNKPFRMIWGHLPRDIGERLNVTMSTATLIREPVDRIISAFHYATQTAQFDQDGQQITLDHYVSRKRHYDLGLDNAMTRVLCGDPAMDPMDPSATTATHPRVERTHFEAAVANLSRFGLVGITERFDEVLVLLARDLGWSLTDMTHERKNVTPERPATQAVSSQVAAKILEWNQYDALLWQHAGGLLRSRIQSLGPSFDVDLRLLRALQAMKAKGVPDSDLRALELREMAAGS